jgi:dolichol-phosphate mannosyltransferase
MFAMGKWSKDKAVSVIIPTYNERDNIIPLVEKLHDTLAIYDYEIVFIDDNSSDGTAELASALSQKYTVKVVVRKNKTGLASAVIDGLREVKGEIVVVMEADLQHPPEILPNILKALESHDLVVASRYCKGGSPGQRTLARRLISFVANLLALPLAPRIKDRMSGFFGFRRTAVDPASLNARGCKIGLEVMVRGRYKSVTEIPYTSVPRTHGSSKLSKRIIWQYLQQLAHLYLHKFRILNFMFVGGIGYAINMLTYWPLTLIFKTEVAFLGQHFYLPPFVISSLVAIVCNYELNKVWTFKGWSEQRLGSLRYLSMALVTLLIDMALLCALVDYCKLAPVPAAALAILIVFIVRYAIARRWVWSENSSEQ